MKIYTTIRISRDSETKVLYCGEDVRKAKEASYINMLDSLAPDRDKYYNWTVMESEFPDCD